MNSKNTPATVTPDETAARAAETVAAIVALRVDGARDIDRRIGLLADADTRSDAELASAVSYASADAGEPDTFEPTDTYPTRAAFIRDRATVKPYAIAPRTIGNYRNAIVFLRKAGIDTADAVSYASALALVSKASAPAFKVADSLRAEGDGAASELARKYSAKGAVGTAATIKRRAAAKDVADARKADPIGTALAALLAGAEGDAAKSTALAALLRAAARKADAQADAAAGGAATVDAVTGAVLAE